jgi:hypothetical protein
MRVALENYINRNQAIHLSQDVRNFTVGLADYL